jgi:hypothetical protein
MAQPSNTYATNDAKGIREDLADIISNIAPYEVPFQSNGKKRKVKNIRHEWQTDSLTAVDLNNAVIEGDDATLDASNPTTRVGNITQIMDKTVVITGSLEAVDKAGRKSELAYQLTKKGRELRRDKEAILLNNQASLIGDDTTARKLGGLPTWLTSNVNRAAGGASGGFSTSTALTVAATDSTTPRTFTETLLKAVQQSCVKNGGSPTILMLGPYNKGQFSNTTNFPGIADLRSNVAQAKGQATVIGAADVYLGDFGALQVVVNLFQREREAFLLDREKYGVGTLRPLKQWELAKSGDSEKRQMLEEVTLVIDNQAAHGVVADLTTS